MCSAYSLLLVPPLPPCCEMLRVVGVGDGNSGSWDRHMIDSHAAAAHRGRAGCGLFPVTNVIVIHETGLLPIRIAGGREN